MLLKELGVGHGHAPDHILRAECVKPRSSLAAPSCRARSRRAADVRPSPSASRPRPASTTRRSAWPATPTPPPSRRTPPRSAFCRRGRASTCTPSSIRDGTVGGRGDGFFVATPLPYLSALSRRRRRAAPPPADVVPLSATSRSSRSRSACALHPGIALGLTYAHLWADRGPVAAGIDTLDVALSLRPRALARRRAGRPRSAVAGGRTASRCSACGTPELAFRPFQTVDRRARRRRALRRAARRRRSALPPVARAHRRPAPSRPTSSGSATSTSTASTRTTSASPSASPSISSTSASAASASSAPTPAWPAGTASRSPRASPAIATRPLARPARTSCASTCASLDERKLARLVLVHAPRRARRATSPASSSSSAISTAAGPPPRSCAPPCSACAAPASTSTSTSPRPTRAATTSPPPPSASIQDPAGGIRLVGLSSTTMFFRGLGDLLGVRADFVKIAEYKSAPEQYTRTELDAEPARAQREAYVGDVWAHLTDGIAAARHVDAATARGWIDRGPYTADEAKAAGLVDELRHGDEVESRHHRAPRPPRRACATRPSSPERENDWERPAVAVLFVDGDIIDGKSATIPLLGMKFVGMQTLMAALQRARDDSRVRAIVAARRLARRLRARLRRDRARARAHRAGQAGHLLARRRRRLGRLLHRRRLLAHLRRAVDAHRLDRHLHRQVRRQRPGRQARRLARDATSAARTPASTRSTARYTDEERALILQQAALLLRPLRRRGGARPQHDARRTSTPSAAATSGRATPRCARGLVDEFGGLMDAVAEAKRRAGLDEHDRVTLEAVPDEPSLLGQLLALFGIGGERASAGQAAATICSRASSRPRCAACPARCSSRRTTPQARLDFDVSDE